MSTPRLRRDKRGEAFLIRAFAEQDRPHLGAMYDDFEPKRIAQGLPPGDAQRRARWLDTILADGRHLVVEVEGRIMGHGMLLPFDDSAELANFIHQSLRDRGIGTALNRALMEEAKASGIRRIWLSVEPSNRRAIRSYEKAGFRRRFASGWGAEVEMEALLGAPESSSPES